MTSQTHDKLGSWHVDMVTQLMCVTECATASVKVTLKLILRPSVNLLMQLFNTRYSFELNWHKGKQTSFAKVVPFVFKIEYPVTWRRPFQIDSIDNIQTNDVIGCLKFVINWTVYVYQIPFRWTVLTLLCRSCGRVYKVM